MTALQLPSNPFALMMEPEAVFAAIASSDRLARLQSRICRPLDKPMLPKAGAEAAEFDEVIDRAAEDAESDLPSTFGM